MWQRGSAIIGGVNFDHDWFDGTEDELKKAWSVATPMTSTNIPGLDVITTIATNDIPTFTPEGVFRGMIKVGDKITVMEGADHIKVFSGISCVESPDDYFVPVANTPGIPTSPPNPPPPPATVPMWVTGTNSVLNVRVSPSTTAPVIRLQDGTYVQIPDGTPIQAIGTGSTVSPFFIQISVVWHGVTVVGYASKTYLTVTAPH